ncbi:MAG: DUF5305 domain-containing protein [Clostridiales bacterium]|nr:DUF5305 domain-containing protein [Clostridiales bacterium]
MKVHMKLGRGKKIACTVVLSCTLIAALAMVFITACKKEMTEKDIVKYDYKISKNIAYKVFLKDNIIYDEDYMEEGLYYPRKLIDYIRLKYDFEYTGSDTVPIRIDYQCFVKISGFVIQQNIKEIYWTKSFPLNEKQSLEVSDRALAVNEEFDVSLGRYITFVNEAKEELGINIDFDIIFSMEGMVKASTAYGEVEESFSFDISSVFYNVCKFSKNGMDAVSGKLTQKQVEPVPLNQTRLAIYISVSGVALLALLYILIFTRDYDLNDIVMLSIKKIQREYGSRMVTLQSNTAKSFNRIYELYSIKDLVKVSDEIQKPILYERDDKELVKDFKFFVQNGEELYEYCVLNSIMQNYR